MLLGNDIGSHNEHFNQDCILFPRNLNCTWRSHFLGSKDIIPSFPISKLTAKVLNTAIYAMIAKAEKPTGNKFTFICNTRLWTEIQDTLSQWILSWKTVGTFMFSQAENDYVKVGTTFNSYEFAGNTVTFPATAATVWSRVNVTV